MKINIYALIIGLSLITISQQIVSMDAINENDSSEEEIILQPGQRKHKKLIQRIVDVIKLKAPLKSLWSPEKEAFDFASLPKDIQNHITQLLITTTNATTLQEAVQPIRALTGVNKELHDYLNNPKIFSDLIISLSTRFNKTPEEVASALEIQASHDYLVLVLNGIDESSPEQLKLLQNPNINVNVKDHKDNTPLINAVAKGSLQKVISLTRNNRLNINAQNKEGNTALHIIFNKIKNTQNSIERNLYMKIAERLLNKGADTSIVNYYGEKPKDIAKLIADPVLDRMIGEARVARYI